MLLVLLLMLMLLTAMNVTHVNATYCKECYSCFCFCLPHVLTLNFIRTDSACPAVPISRGRWMEDS